MAVDLKQQTKRLLEGVFGQGKVELIDELCDPQYRGEDPVDGPYDREGFKKQVQKYRGAFPDLKFEVVEAYVDGSTVVSRWKATGTHRGPLGELPATGKSATTSGITITEFQGDKVVADRTEWNAWGMLAQLGAGAAAPAPERTEAKATEARH